MKTKTYNTWKFEELSEKIQQKIIENYYDINVDHEWWDFTYDDAKEIGLKITAFDIDRGSYCEGEFLVNDTEVIIKILENHEETTRTYKTAKEYEKDVNDDESNANFLHSLLEDYRIILGEEYEYMTSEEAIKESLIMNEYDFTTEGKID